MEKAKFIQLKKEEFGIKGYIRRSLGKGKISRLDIEYTPVGEKIVVSTSRPGLVIGRKGERIEEFTKVLKRRFKLKNPHIEINEIEHPLFDAQIVADEIALALERMGNLKFKVIAYRKLQEIMDAGALGCELRLTGKLPSERAKSWRFAEGYLKKAGESRKEIDRAQATALTKTGIIGIKAAIMSPTARIYDKIDIDDKLKAKIRNVVDEEEPKKVKSKKKTEKKKVTKRLLEKDADKSIKKMIEKKEKTEKDADKKGKDKKSSLMEKGETKVIKESQPNEEEGQEIGSAMEVEEKIEEGVPESVEKDIKKVEAEEAKEKKK